jgi:hypothetical protein
MPQQEEWVRKGLVFHSTREIIRAVEGPDIRGPKSDVGGKNQRSEVGGLRSEVRFPDKVMITVHPQRWDDRPWPWVREFVFQSVKNLGKRLVIAVRAGKHSANRGKDQLI